MKAIHIVAGIIGISVLFAGAIALRSKLRYSADEAKIVELTAKIKKLGVATNGAEYFHPIPDSQNMWTDLRPLLFKEQGKDMPRGELFKSGLGSSFLAVAAKSDLPLIHKYLEANRQRRDAIAAVLKEDKQLQVPHDYDDGFLMLLPELATFKTVGREFCLAAFAAAMEGHADQVIANLEVARKLSNYCVDRGEELPVLVGLAIRAQMNQTCLRVIEQAPELYESIQRYIDRDGLFSRIKCRQVLETRFLEQIATCRYLDVPKADQRELPFPLSLLPKKSTEENDPLNDGKAQHSDYVPTTHTMRAFMCSRLELWEPFLAKLVTSKDPYECPSYADYAPIDASMTKAPEFIANTLGMETFMNGDKQSYYSLMNREKNYTQAMKFVWAVLEIRRKTGHYPANLSDVGVKLDSFDQVGGLVFASDQDGFLLKSVDPDDQTRFKIGFPISRTREAATNKDYRETIDKYRTGKTDRNGNDPKAGSPPSP